MDTTTHHPESDSHWWLASDGRWYPPELRSSTLPPPPPTAVALPTGTSWTYVQPSTAVQDASTEDPGTRWSTRHTVVVVLCLLYMFSPVDMLPELLLGPFGLVDDGFALMVAIVAAGLGLRADATSGEDER
jgi:hypothetical protein